MSFNSLSSRVALRRILLNIVLVEHVLGTTNLESQKIQGDSFGALCKVLVGIHHRVRIKMRIMVGIRVVVEAHRLTSSVLRSSYYRYKNTDSRQPISITT